jgi:hypothetical protein
MECSRASEEETRFDELVQLWLQVDSIRNELRRIYSVADAALGEVPNHVLERNNQRLHLILDPFPTPPEKWKLCRFCSGRGTEDSGTSPCVMCYGSGFTIEQEAELLEES